MNNTQNIIVFLWLLPLFGFIILPLLWSIAGMLYRAIERSRLGEISGYVSLNNRDDADTEEDENRGRPRIHLEGGTACIDEERGCCKAAVADISKRGICLKHVPEKMSLESDPIRLVVRTRQKDYTMTATPVWKKLTRKGYVIGAEINQISETWKNFVKGLSRSLDSRPA